LASGFRPALAVGLGSLAGDALWVTLALAGAASLAGSRGIHTTLVFVGAIILLGLGLRALKGARPEKLERPAGSSRDGAFATGAAIGIASPYALPFWLGVGASLPSFGVASPGPLDYAVFIAFFMLTCLAYALFVAGAIAWGRRLIQPRFFAVVNVICAIALIVFGLHLLGAALLHGIG
jgi:threonine/homoserine/homoserine lactone efflux protein